MWIPLYTELSVVTHLFSVFNQFQAGKILYLLLKYVYGRKR